MCSAIFKVYVFKWDEKSSTKVLVKDQNRQGRTGQNRPLSRTQTGSSKWKATKTLAHNLGKPPYFTALQATTKDLTTINHHITSLTTDHRTTEHRTTHNLEPRLTPCRHFASNCEVSFSFFPSTPVNPAILYYPSYPLLSPLVIASGVFPTNFYQLVHGFLIDDKISTYFIPSSRRPQSRWEPVHCRPKPSHFLQPHTPSLHTLTNIQHTPPLSTCPFDHFFFSLCLSYTA